MIKHLSLISILLLSLFVRLPLLNGSLWLDEAAQALESMRPLSQQLAIQADFQPPLYHLWVHLFTYVSRSVWWLRLASLIPAILTVYLTYHLGRLLNNQRMGIIAALLLATSQFHVFYSQELRPYSLAALFGIVSLLLFLKLSKKPSPTTLVLYALIHLAGLYTVYTFMFFTITQLAWLVVSKKVTTKQMLLVLVCIGIGYVPWVIPLTHQLKASQSVRQTLFGWEQIVAYPQSKALPLTMVKLLFGRLEIPNQRLLEVGLTVLALFVATASAFLSNFKHKQAFMFLSIIPLGLAFIISFFIPLIDPKRFLFLLPLLYIFIANAHSHPKAKLLIPLVLVVNVLGLFRYWTNPDDQRENWQQAVQVIEQDALGQKAAIAVSFHEPFAPLTYYRLDLPVLTNKKLSAQSFNRLYYFEYLQTVSDPTQLVRHSLEAQGYYEAGFFQYPAIGKIVIMDRTQAKSSNQ